MTKRRRRVEWFADLCVATHIGEIFQLFCCCSRQNFIANAGFVWPFFPHHTSQLLAKGSASIQLICQSAWLGQLLLLGAARVICKIHCSTISVESCVLTVFFSQVRGGKIQRSDWLTNLIDSLCYCCCCLWFCFLCSCLSCCVVTEAKVQNFHFMLLLFVCFLFYCFACELWLEGSLRKSA